MKLILQAVKSLFRKMGVDVNRAQATAETAQATAETALDRWNSYDLVVCLCDTSIYTYEIASANAPRLVKGDYENVKNTLANGNGLRVFLYAHSDIAFQEYSLDYIFLDEDDYFQVYVKKGTDSSARMYLTPTSNVIIDTSEWD